MFALAIYIGIYSYLIFLLGAIGLIYKPLVLITTVIYLLIPVILFRSRFQELVKKVSVKNLSSKFKNNRLFVFVFLIVIAQALINLIGVFGPEISFDSRSEERRVGK